ncbi:type II secretion system F family protein [Corynebacterium uberis]|uniref:type II secretion system F family protein n=1 Tax=Corynebacterium TaxID=1716 RepID=UPI001D09E03B|nr:MULTISPECIES: type II secretion system F family protein [Corynebacterium]MCZ9309957.1 type II secretion system F family protein [Corynebacterium sp. c6VSa_13]UDL73124.1 type II secretion system F family protein [Corynebacterium uberis]UDL75999.1 type II secretion system F family protein [Corynebacterium uberis]UDL78211.1 type II secretion system F family protein [Corynebacterium uberis]UDL80494.1 type II secretion system F family protein [Corynebacterium uberis]
MTLALLLASVACLLGDPCAVRRLGDLPRARDGPPPARRFRSRRTNWQLLSAEISADVDLYAACVEAGLSTATAARVVAGCCRSPRVRAVWATVAALAAIGVPAQRAWEAAAGVPGLEQLAQLVSSSQQSGARVVEGARRIAQSLRQDSADSATARAERAGVLIAMPLTLCFLPAFLILGLAPVIISLAAELLA